MNKILQRKAKVERKTKETNISCEVLLDGTGKYDIQTGIGFLNHMIEQVARHGLIDINLKADGDLHIDMHHTTEDVGIVLGAAIKKALPSYLLYQAVKMQQKKMKKRGGKKTKKYGGRKSRRGGRKSRRGGTRRRR